MPSPSQSTEASLSQSTLPTEQSADEVCTTTLESAAQQLSAFEFIHCGMEHEKIQRSGDGVEPLRNALADHGFQRFPYCSSGIRTQRLGCAHTSARGRFLQILNQLPPELASDAQWQLWKQELQQLDLDIIQVDRQKSDAELRHAKHCSIPEYDAFPSLQQKLEQTESHIQHLIHTHQQYIQRLRQLRDAVLCQINRRLA